MWRKVKKEIAGLIRKKYPALKIRETDFVFPPNPEFGDLSLPCFNLAKETKKNPAEVAEEISKALKPGGMVAKISATGPYLNFFLAKNKFILGAVGKILKENKKYGDAAQGKKKKVMVEFSNANTHKEYHVGHLRNLCYGDTVTRILSASGRRAIPVSYINDFGIHVAKTLWAYEKFFKKEKIPANKGYFLGQVYSRSTKEAEADPKAKEEIAAIMEKIESRRGPEYKLWQKTRKWSIEQFAGIYKQMGVKFEKTFYESEFIDKGKKMVEELLRKKILVKSEGAVIADLEKYGLGVLLFLRSDGTALYPVADLPLAAEKFRKYKLDSSIYVVDVRQSLYFKQLFKVLELLGYKKEMVHLGYEFVKLPSGMMSSRTGNVVTFENLWSEAMRRAVAETEKRHPGWSSKQISEVAGKIVAGALRFEMIKVGKEQVITFDLDRALRFDGFTAAYLQYTHARICSIVEKSGVKNIKTANLDKLNERWEYELSAALAKFSDMVVKAAEAYSPAVLADYLYELAKIFSDFYRDVRVIGAEQETTRARLALVLAVRVVLAKGMELLGVDVLEKM